jgi:hypothetical protein
LDLRPNCVDCCKRFSRLAATLSETQQQWQQQGVVKSKSIFLDGLSVMGPLSETTRFTSNPSMPTEERHITGMSFLARLAFLFFVVQRELPALFVGKLNICYQDPEEKTRREEHIMWKQVYSHLSPVATAVRTAQVMGQTALLMP